MSSKAWRIPVDYEFLSEISSEDVSFNWSHSDIQELLEIIRDHELPFDNGGMAVPVLIYDWEVDRMRELIKNKEFIPQWNNIVKILDIIENDMTEAYGIVLYYLV